MSTMDQIQKEIGMYGRILGAVVCLFAGAAMAAEYAPSAIDGWQSIIFKGHTDYQRDGECVRATSSQAASGLIQEVNQPLASNPILTWRWQADAPIKPGKNAPEKDKEGDDFVARAYVIQEGFFPWQTKALNYVWSREHPVGSYWPNPFTSNAMMVVVQTGESGLGEWHTFQRDVRADFKTYFDIDAHTADAVAVMTDTDNTGGTAQACYQLPAFEVTK